MTTVGHYVILPLVDGIKLALDIQRHGQALVRIGRDGKPTRLPPARWQVRRKRQRAKRRR